MSKLGLKLTVAAITCLFSTSGTLAWAQNFASTAKKQESTAPAAQTAEPAKAEANVNEEPLTLESIQAMVNQLPEGKPSTKPADSGFDPLKYTLGPEDIVEISVMRHPEFSGSYPIDKEGKLQYKFVGDIQVTGLTKVQLEEKIKGIISKFIIAPEVNVTITDYKSKVFYVIGEVGAPGRYYMRSETISVREAVVMAGLPTQAAAMRKSQIITPSDKGGKIKMVDVYGLLYGGDLRKNLVMKPGDFLYVPSTVMAKVFRVISPVSNAVGVAASPATSANTGKTNAQDLAR